MIPEERIKVGTNIVRSARMIGKCAGGGCNPEMVGTVIWKGFFAGTGDEGVVIEFSDSESEKIGLKYLCSSPYYSIQN